MSKQFDNIESAKEYGKSPYGDHLKRVAEGKIISKPHRRKEEKK